jgi:hypothetical protein
MGILDCHEQRIVVEPARVLVPKRLELTPQARTRSPTEAVKCAAKHPPLERDDRTKVNMVMGKLGHIPKVLIV